MMKIPVIEKKYGYFLLSQKIHGLTPVNESRYFTEREEKTLYWYTRKQLGTKYSRGYIEV